MGSENGKLQWSVFDGIKKIPSNPDNLMSKIDTAINNLEYARATASTNSKFRSVSPSHAPRMKIPEAREASQYDARMADVAYRAGCAALAAGKLDEALQALNVSLSKCPPEKTGAVAKLQSLISLTSQQLHKM